MEDVMEIQEIMELLPHRYPFILVDRILEVVADERIIALKNVTINEPFFQGHFPKAPIMPGVLIMEAMAQAGGVLYFSSLPKEKQGALLYFMGMDNVRFRKPVVPGDQLIFDVQITKKRSRAVKLSGKATVNETLVAEADFMATVGEKL